MTISNSSTSLLKNPSLETATNNVPDCWQLGSSGSNTATWTWTTDAHTGSRAEQVQISSFSSGDRKLVVKQDSGTCAPTVSSGTRYTLGAYYKSSTGTRFILFYRNAAGNWVTGPEPHIRHHHVLGAGDLDDTPRPRWRHPHLVRARHHRSRHPHPRRPLARGASERTRYDAADRRADRACRWRHRQRKQRHPERERERQRRRQRSSSTGAPP